MYDASLSFTTPGTPWSPTALGQNLSPNYIDALAAMDLGAGAAPLAFVVVTTTAATSGGSATVDFQLLGNPTSSTFGSGNTILVGNNPLAYTVFALGFRLQVQTIQRAAMVNAEGLPGGSYSGPLRYFVANAQIATAVLTGGAWIAFLCPAAMVYDNEAAGQTIGYTIV